MQKIVFLSTCETKLKERFGANKLINSFKYFHSNIQFIFHEDNDIKRILQHYQVNFHAILPCIMKDVKEKYNAEYVCHIDADSIVFSYLKEILDFDYEIASVRNNSDSHTQDERENRPIGIKDLPNNLYVSCGCICTNSNEFLNGWINYNKEIIRIYGGVKCFWMCDQNMMNILFHSGKYKTKILDQTGTNLYYGASANMYSGGKPEYIRTEKDPQHIIKEWGVNNWQSWREMTYDNGEFFLHGRKVKILHQAGGGNPKTAIKLSFDMFDSKIVSILQKITQCEK